MADDASRDCGVCIIEAQLYVRYIKLSDEKYRNIQQSLQATTACYPIKRLVTKTHSVAQEISSLNWENAHVRQLPNRGEESSSQVSREKLPIHCHAWTCIPIITLECTSPAKRILPKNFNEKKFFSTQSLNFILAKNQSDYSMVL